MMTNLYEGLECVYNQNNSNIFELRRLGATILSKKSPKWCIVIRFGFRMPMSTTYCVVFHDFSHSLLLTLTIYILPLNILKSIERGFVISMSSVFCNVAI